MKSKITKDKNGENVPRLGIIELVLVYYNIVNNNYQQDSRVLDTFIPIWSIIRYFTQNFYIFKKPLIQKFHKLKYGLLIKILTH